MAPQNATRIFRGMVAVSCREALQVNYELRSFLRSDPADCPRNCPATSQIFPSCSRPIRRGNRPRGSIRGPRTHLIGFCAHTPASIKYSPKHRTVLASPANVARDRKCERPFRYFINSCPSTSSSSRRGRRRSNQHPSRSNWLRRALNVSCPNPRASLCVR